MDWVTVFKPISDNMSGHLTLAFMGFVALFSTPILIKAAVSLAASGIRYLYQAFS